MASKRLEASVTHNAGGWDFVCPITSGCGNPGTGESFTSREWPTKKHALARGQQHLDEHAGRGVMQELHNFRVANGLSVNSEGKAVVDDDEDEGDDE